MRLRDKILFRIRFWLQDIHELMFEFRMRFDENMLGRCGACGLHGPHKMDCTREWRKEIRNDRAG